MCKNCGYIIVSDYLNPDGKHDVSDDLQRLIDTNPNHTLFFPDGTYLLRKPVLTPADPRRSVDLQLSNYAVIKASDDWDSPEAMLRLGASHPANDIITPGSNYSLSGGILDGNGKANGISIDGGRETAIRNVSLKHTVVGIHIKRGANNGSSDADISNVNIVGTGGTDSIGVLVEGWDNTFTNMRIANVFIGVDLKTAGNILRNIHPLYTSDYTDYTNSCAFRDAIGHNWFNICYSDQFGVGYRMLSNASSNFDSCFCMWYSPKGEKHIAMKADMAFNSIVSKLRIGFHSDAQVNIVLEEGQSPGQGVLEHLFATPALITDEYYQKYLIGSVIS